MSLVLAPRAISLTEGVYERLRADLLACRLAPGMKLKIADLAAETSVSIGLVREALSRLAAEGLVAMEAQKGFRVPSIAVDDLKALTEARIEIEAVCLKLAIARGDIAWEADIIAAFHRLSHVPERAPDDETRLSDDYAAAHTRFHAALVAACDNAWLLKTRETLFAQSERYRRLSVPMQNPIRDVDKEHRAIMTAVLARRVDEAIEATRAHLTATMTILLGSGLCD
ncbi:MAG: FCD domain-containing protein [Alphaproteobacteria bacterium]